jgi:hypothetical protein
MMITGSVIMGAGFLFRQPLVALLGSAVIVAWVTLPLWHKRSTP